MPKKTIKTETKKTVVKETVKVEPVEKAEEKTPVKTYVKFLKNYIGTYGVFMAGEKAEVDGNFADSLFKNKGAEKC